MSFVNNLAFGGPDGMSSSPWRKLLGMSVGLAYLVFPATEIVTGVVSGARAFWAGASLVAFVASYLATVLTAKSFTERNSVTFPLLVLTTLLAVVPAFVFGGSWICLLVYTVVLYCMGLPPRWALWCVGANLAVILVCGIVTGADFGSVLVFALEVVTLGVLFISVRNTRILAYKLGQAQGEVARLAATDERLRIARDLHDLLGHSLSLIVLKSELAGRLAGDEPKVRHEISDIESVARQALVEVREAVTGYRQRSLSEELDNARSVLRSAGVDPHVRISGTPLHDLLDGLFGWAVREGVTNVIRHARATRCDIDVAFDGRRATLEIMDNGRGGESLRLGSGLQGLTERVHGAGGSVETGTAPKGGFQLRVLIPVSPVSRANVETPA